MYAAHENPDVDHGRCSDICENRQALIIRRKLWTS